MAAKRPRYRLFQLALFLAPNGLAEKEGELYHFAAASWYNTCKHTETSRPGRHPHTKGGLAMKTFFKLLALLAAAAGAAALLLRPRGARYIQVEQSGEDEEF